MELRRFDDPKEFFDLVAPVLTPREIEHSLFLGSMRYLVTTKSEGFMAALSGPGAPMAAALRTPPHDLVVAVTEPDMVVSLADGIHALGESIPGVFGLQDIAHAFANRWAQRASHVPRLNHDLIFYALRSVTAPASAAPGRLRLATDADEPWLVDWTEIFAREARVSPAERERSHIVTTVRGRIARSQQFVWEHDGRPVCVVAFVRTGISGARVQMVMTAHAERGRGFASAAVAALVEKLLASGIAWCGLFADVTHPQANRIYRRLGFREACRFSSIGFGL